VTLDFEKVSGQVERMGRALAARTTDLDGRLAEAWDYFKDLDDLGTIHERVQLTRERDAGYRGAALPDAHLEIIEPVNESYPLPPLPPRATILAADGSQVYPNLHAAALYYLTNVGVFIYHHGVDELPEQITEPRLHYSDDEVHDDRGQVISNDAVNKRRSVMELEVLGRETWHRRDRDCPLVAISDGPLLFWVGKDVPDGDKLETAYLGAIVHLHDAHADMQRRRNQSASLIGYVDRPTSSFLISLVHLMSLYEEDVRRATLQTNGDWEGLTDRQLLFRLLCDEPGARSAIMVQQSPQNKRYHDRGENLEVAFFYLNVGTLHDYQIARVEMPIWVARDADAVDRVHALVYDQCQMMWRYPYALTRADELAVIRGHEKSQLEEMIEVELRKNEQLVEHSAKATSKTARHGRTSYARSRR
jgi:hypothetical protein